MRLREADLVAGGSPDRFAAWDTATAGPVIVGTDRLGFPDDVTPALDGHLDGDPGRRLRDRGHARASPS